MPTSPPVTCDLCGNLVPPHAHYVVRMEIFADPSAPPIDVEHLTEADFADEWAKLMASLQNLSADDAQDQVHRGFEYKLCRPCQMIFLRNPLGKPRVERPGSN